MTVHSVCLDVGLCHSPRLVCMGVFRQTCAARRNIADTVPCRKDDPYCRLRVPRYLKLFEVLFFAVFLTLYSLVLVERHASNVTALEAILWLWIAAFAYDEYGQYMDAGLAFYIADFWSLWDFGIILIGVMYFITRMLSATLEHTVTDPARRGWLGQP